MSRSRSRSSGTARAEEDVPRKKTAKASAVARVTDVLMVGSPGLVDVAMAAGTIRAYASTLRVEDQRKYDAGIHLPFRSAASARSRTCLCEVSSAEVCFALFTSG